MGVAKMYQALMCAILDEKPTNTSKNFLRRSESATPTPHETGSERTTDTCAFCAEHINYFAENKCEAYGTVIVHALPEDADFEKHAIIKCEHTEKGTRAFFSTSPKSRRRPRAWSLARTLSGSKKHTGQTSTRGEEKLQHALTHSLSRRESDSENAEDYITASFAVRNGKIHIKCKQQCSHGNTEALGFMDEKNGTTLDTTTTPTTKNSFLGQGHLTFREECVSVRRLRLDVGGSSYEVRCRPHTRLGAIDGHTMYSEMTVVLLLTVNFTPDVLENLPLTSWLDAKACGWQAQVGKRNSAFVWIWPAW